MTVLDLVRDQLLPGSHQSRRGRRLLPRPLLKALDQRPEAAAPSAQEEGAYLRIHRDIFGGEVVFFYIFALW